MNTSEKNTKTLYESLGKLFYAVAAADRVIRDIELETLRNKVKEKWLLINPHVDEYGSNTAFQIETVFDWAQEGDLDSKTCYKDFKTFYRDHTYLFTDELKKVIFDTCQAIADSFSGKNKAELYILAKLHLLFKKRQN